MNFLQLMENQMTTQRVSHVQVAARTPAPVHPVIRHRDPNPVMSLLVVICFVLLLVGLVVLTTHLDRPGKSKPHAPSHNMPMVSIGQ